MSNMGIYEQFIAKSRYCRYLPELNRRESWEETVARYFNFMQDHLLENNNWILPPALRAELEIAVINLEIMPSMRCLMTAGEALKRNNIAGYNCSYLAVDDIKSFDEAMLILLCGTGVGFSVERQEIQKLPIVPERFNSGYIIAVDDSKEGWALALRSLITHLYNGDICSWDISKVRPAGTPLKTFGGRASGPEPLVELFEFVIHTFKQSKGRRLTSLQCHDIMCKIGETVVVGGVRRSAMISLSNLSDMRMQEAKSGEWWRANPQRALANNSICYTERPEVGIFMKEWQALYESKSGERGVFNRVASDNQVAKLGRRKAGYRWGTNPCSEIILRPQEFCNLSEVVVRAEDTIQTLKRKVELATILGTFQSTLINFPGLRDEWTENTKEERLLGVSLTGILDNVMMTNNDDDKMPHLRDILTDLKDAAVDTNKELAAELGIPQSAAITCVKPSGTVSQLVNSASGIHTRHAPYYIRRVRGDIKDPLTQFMIAQGVENEPCVMRPNNTVVFSFPQKAPEGGLTRGDLTAIEHLNLWLTYQHHWCEHKPSITVSVKEHEWPEVGAFVWNHFDEISGVSFLPEDGGSYKQAPYEEITKDEYEAMLARSVKSIDWSQMQEISDTTEGAQSLACTGNSCEL